MLTDPLIGQIRRNGDKLRNLPGIQAISKPCSVIGGLILCHNNHVTLSIVGDEILIHTLTRQDAETLESGEMDRRVTELEGQLAG